MIAYIGLGSNLGDSLKTLKSALAELTSHPKITLKQTSSFYKSKPHGSADQPDYLNAVTEIETRLSSHHLLDALQQIEHNHKRVRTKQHWEPRTLDLDLLLYGEETIHSERLTVPHPRIGERSFVVYPLAEIKKDLIFPDGKVLTDYLANISDDDLCILEEEDEQKP